MTRPRVLAVAAGLTLAAITTTPKGPDAEPSTDPRRPA